MLMDRDYRNFLRQTLVERCQKNPAYSLRAFARDLRLDPARLSDVLNGKKGLSRQAAEAIAKRLGMTPAETEAFCDRVDALHARSRVTREAAQIRVDATVSNQDSRQLTLDVFRAVSDWQHFAILQLLKLPDTSDQPERIANALGLKPVQAQEALDRLERLGLIEMRDGRRVPSDDTVLAPDGVPSDAIKKFHEQILKKAIDALFIQPVEERDYFTMLTPLEASDVDAVRKRIRAFAKEIDRDYSEKPAVNRVYCLSMQFFNLTPNLKGD